MHFPFSMCLRKPWKRYLVLQKSMFLLVGWGGAVGNGVGQLGIVFFDLKGPEKEGGSSLEKK